MSRARPLAAWLELLRIGNTPTILSNVCAGIAIGMHARLAEASLPVVTVVTLCVGGALIYMSGMVLNDAFDSRIDGRERPRRPIPSGRIARFHAQVVGVFMLVIGATMLEYTSPATLYWSLLLVVGVVVYNATHQWFPGAVLMVGACRGFLVLIAAFAISPGAEWSLVWWISGGLFFYVSAVSIAARNEMRGFGAAARVASWLLPVAACAPLGMWFVEGVRPEGAFLITTGLAAMAVSVVSVVAGIRVASMGAVRWTVPAAVSIWLGAIPAIDAATCFLLGRPLLGLFCAGMWVGSGALRRAFAAS